jgi:transcription antitermination factor NusG
VLHWYSLNSLPRSEKTLARGLKRWEQSWPISVYLPMLPQRKGPGKLASAVPLFPGYLFCRCDWDIVPVSVLRWTPGLRQVVGFDHVPAIVPDDAIQAIKERLLVAGETGGLPLHTFRHGELVQIKSGPLQGLLGVFDGPMQASERVRILVEFLGRVNEVRVQPELLESPHKPPRRTRGHGRWIQPFSPGAQSEG